MSFYIMLTLIFFSAGFVQGVTGFGSALLAMPLLLLILDARTAVPLCMLNGLLITLFLSFQLKRHLDWKKKMAPLVIGSIPGIITGVTFLKRAGDDTIKLFLGLMLIGYSFYSLYMKPRPRKLGRIWAYVAGFSTGAIGAAFSAGGPPTIIYTTLTGWPKDEIKATLSGFFLITGMLSTVAHAMTGLTTVTVLGYLVWTAVPVLLGVATGSVFYGRLSREGYMRSIYFLLICMGLMMIISGFEALSNR